MSNITKSTKAITGIDAVSYKGNTETVRNLPPHRSKTPKSAQQRKTPPQKRKPMIHDVIPPAPPFSPRSRHPGPALPARSLLPVAATKRTCMTHANASSCMTEILLFFLSATAQFPTFDTFVTDLKQQQKREHALAA